MAFNLTTIRNSNPTHLTVIKKCQIYGTGLGIPPFLTNHTNRPFATHEKLSDPDLILNPGDQLRLLSILSPYEACRSESCLKVQNAAGLEFNILSSNISRFLSL